MHMRVGRISASKMGECVGKVRDGEVAGAIFSVLQDIMGYRDFFSSAATSWRLFNEQAACDSFVNFAKQNNSGLFIHDCGLFVSTACLHLSVAHLRDWFPVPVIQVYGL